MRVVIDIILKSVQVIFMPIIMKLIDVVFKIIQEKYKNDEDFRKKVDDLFGKMTSNWGPKFMKIYFEYQARAAKKEQAKEKRAASRKSSADDESTDVDSHADEPDLVESAAETAKIGAKVARRYAGQAGRKTKRLISRTGEWLREELEQEDQNQPKGPDEKPEPTGQTEPDPDEELKKEDEEIARLRRKLAEELADKGKSSPDQPRGHGSQQNSRDLEELLRQERERRDSND